MFLRFLSLAATISPLMLCGGCQSGPVAGSRDLAAPSGDLTATSEAATMPLGSAHRYRLGAGDHIGRAVFDHYAAVIRSRPDLPVRLARAQPTAQLSTAEPPIAARDRWIMALLADGWIVWLSDLSGSEAAVHHLSPWPTSPQTETGDDASAI